MVCKGICERHKALKPIHRFGRRYSAGQKKGARHVDYLSSEMGYSVPAAAVDLGQVLETQ